MADVTNEHFIHRPPKCVQNVQTVGTVTKKEHAFMKLIMVEVEW